MKVIHDIRQQIPQFSANFFAPYEYQPYPRMMVDKTDPKKPKPYLDATKKPIIVQDEHEEKLFLAQHYKPEVTEAPKAIEVPVAAPVIVQPMAVAAVETEPKRRGRPPANKLPQDLK